MNTKTILIVDDEIEQLDTIIDVFESAEYAYRLLQALNGKKALEIAEKEHPDLIITDWDMPEMTGIELIQHLKENETLADIPVIMCTGVMTDSKNLDIALKAGAADYVRKPIDKVELIARTYANMNLIESYRKIKRLNESKDRLISILSHDLKSPVGNIKAYLELLLDPKTEISQPELIEALKQIARQSSAAYSLLENLFSWANSQRNSIAFEPQNQAVLPLVNQTISLLENIARDKHINIYNEVPGEVMAYCDANLISTVVRNCIANAIKFTPEGGTIRIKAECRTTATRVIIEDTGIGISPEKLENLFDESTFETSFGTNHERGSGLGLKLCNYFMEMHKGTIRVESKEGKGSRFIFTLPENTGAQVS